MQFQFTDFNDAGSVIATRFAVQWQQLDGALKAMPLHVKGSDQARIQGRPIFDPVGTNNYIKKRLGSQSWSVNVEIPPQYDFLGTDVDFVSAGLVMEAQFSNYPFLLNNLLRSELFFHGQIALAGAPVEAAIIITKCHLFPASNSTLYYEQALKQLAALGQQRVFDVPIRLIGLFEPADSVVTAIWTEYAARRYSRTVRRQTTRQFRIELPNESGRASLIRDRPRRR